MADLHKHEDDKLIRLLRRVIAVTVRGLAIMMTLVIILATVDVAWTLHQKAMDHPRFVLTITDILATFGAFMAVLIAIEIFFNIILYLREDVIHVKIVIATALMAISRKVIILDFDEVTPLYVLGIAAVVVAMSVAYWIVNKIETTESHHL